MQDMHCGNVHAMRRQCAGNGMWHFVHTDQTMLCSCMQRSGQWCMYDSQQVNTIDGAAHAMLRRPRPIT